jgi:hypothetical protein
MVKRVFHILMHMDNQLMASVFDCSFSNNANGMPPIKKNIPSAWLGPFNVTVFSFECKWLGTPKIEPELFR